MDVNLSQLSGNLAGRATPRTPNMTEILSSPNVTCKKCGSKVFLEGMVIKKISGLLTATGEDTIIPIPVYYCAKCGEVLTEFYKGDYAAKLLGETTKIETK